MAEFESESDARLMVRVQEADAEAFSALVSRHAHRFYGTVWRIVQNREEAEDIVQDSFARLWEDPFLWHAEQGASFTTWFIKILVNRAIDALRRGKRFSPGGTDALDPDLFEDPAPGAEIILIDRERHQALERAIADLVPNQKAAVALCYGEGMSGREAAENLGIGVKALESLLSRAKETLRRKMTQNEERDGERGEGKDQKNKKEENKKKEIETAEKRAREKESVTRERSRKNG